MSESNSQDEGLELTDLPGVGPSVESRIKSRGYNSLDDLIEASVAELLEVRGLGRNTIQSAKIRIDSRLDVDAFEDDYLLDETVEVPEDAIKWEEEIVWIEDADQHPYVRERFVVASQRSGSFPWKHAGRLVGYANMREDMPNTGTNGFFKRRAFFLKSNDYYEYPSEAVDPDTVSPGEFGAHPEE